MLESVKKYGRYLIVALLLSTALYGNSAPAKKTGGGGSSGPTVRPFLCESGGSDGSLVSFINVKNNSIIGVRLISSSDSGGALIQHLSNAPVGTSTFTVNVAPTATTGNLLLQLVVALTDGTRQTSMTVSPTGTKMVGDNIVCTFNFKQYGWTPTLNITGVAVQASPNGSSPGTLSLFKYTMNGTAITTKIPSTGGCL